MRFIRKTYEIYSDKINDGKSISMVLLSDLHLAEYGEGNRHLIHAIKTMNPDVIVSSGDMITAKPDHATKIAEDLFRELASDYPVYYSMGNHEERLKVRTDLYGDLFSEYTRHLENAGVKLLQNEHELIKINGIGVCIYGLQLPLSYFQRMSRIQLEQEVLRELLGMPDKESFNILLAHHPRYAESYFQWGADLTLSGHVHGGVMRLGRRACVSPDLSIFPRYGYGKFVHGTRHMIVSGGLGEHTIPFRLFNPKELIHLVIK